MINSLFQLIDKSNLIVQIMMMTTLCGFWFCQWWSWYFLLDFDRWRILIQCAGQLHLAPHWEMPLKLDSAFEIIFPPSSSQVSSSSSCHHQLLKLRFVLILTIRPEICTQMGRISAPQFSGISLGLIRGEFEIKACLKIPHCHSLCESCQRVELVELEGRRVPSLRSCKHRSTHSGLFPNHTKHFLTR